MAIQREYGNKNCMLLFSCDTCGRIEEFSGRVKFTDALDALRDSWWKFRYVMGEWVHGCPNCGVGL